MPPKRKKAQPRLEVQKYKLLRQPMNLIGTQVKFLGSFWEGRMTPEEKAAEYKCTVLDFKIGHRMQPGAQPTQHEATSSRSSLALGCWQTPTSTRPTSLCWSGLASTRRPSSRQWQRSRRSTTSCSEAKGASTRRAPRARPGRHLHRRPGRPGRLRRRMPPPWHREYLAAVPCIVCGSVCVF